MSKNSPGTVLPFPYQIESAGVDWITLTQQRTKASETLYDRGVAIVRAEVERGEDNQAWRWQGYRGYRCGGVSVGLRRDGFIVQLRSETARERALDIVPTADNVSRLDLQITARLDEARPQFIRSEYARLRRGRRKVGRPVEHTLIDSRYRGSSLYLGRRSSDSYGRLYDKGGEERTAPLGTSMRWEVEFKRAAAAQATAELLTAQSSAAASADIVSAYFAGRGVRCVSSKYEGLKIPRAPQVGAASRRFVYLSSIVAPMVEKLLEFYTREEIIKALGLDDDAMIERSTFKRGRVA